MYSKNSLALKILFHTVLNILLKVCNFEIIRLLPVRPLDWTPLKTSVLQVFQSFLVISFCQYILTSEFKGYSPPPTPPPPQKKKKNLKFSVFAKITDQKTFPVGIYFFIVNNENTRTMCKICSNLKTKTLESRH